MSDFHISVSSKKISGFRHSEILIRGREIPSPLDNFCMVQLSDPHLGVYTSPEVIRKSVNICNTLSPDLVLLTGDYIHLGRQEVRTLMHKALGPAVSKYTQYRRLARHTTHELSRLFQELKPKEGIIGIWGNHDYLEGKRTLKRFLPQNIIWLENQTVDLTIKGSTIRISGIDDYRFGTPDIKKTITTTLENKQLTHPPAFKLFLSHNPDTILLPDNELLHSYNLILCGHTHGGQICLPGSIPIKTQTKQRKILKGLKNFEKAPVYVSSGIGCSGLPLRLFCPPEIVSVRLICE